MLSQTSGCVKTLQAKVRDFIGGFREALGREFTKII
jgi:hypothetical protein